MNLRFWGVRGSFPAPGSDFLRYGGNTPAVEIVSDDGRRLLLDIGTGATVLAGELMAAEFGKGRGRLPILLTHTHLDHIQGLPFFPPFYVKGNDIRIYGADPAGGTLRQTLQAQLNPHYSPLYGLENLAAGVGLESLQPGASLSIDGFEIRCAAVPHGKMETLSFRIEADGVSVVYMTDIEHPEGGSFPPAVELARDADLVIHGAMYGDDEYDEHRGWGHSSATHALALAEASGARSLALFHYSPDATDDRVDDLISQAAWHAGITVFGATEGPPLRVPPGGIQS